MSKVRSGSSGYTIVETMIFLAVSGALLLSVMLLFNGRQRKTEFETAVREYDSKLQSIIANVSNGYYNNPGSFTCTVSAGVITIANSSSPQGQNSDCTFVGQWVDLIGPANDKFTVTSYAGLRRFAGPPAREVQNLTEANPTAITATVEDYNLLEGVRASMKIVGKGNINALAVTTTFNQSNSAGLLSSGSSRMELHAVIAGVLQTYYPEDVFQICLTDGDQVGIIVLNHGSTNVSIGSTCP